MRRREFLGLPLLLLCDDVFAQSVPVRRIAIMSNSEENDTRIQGLIAVFREALLDHGWKLTDSLELTTFWTGNTSDRAEQAAKSISVWRPDVVFCVGSLQLRSMMRANPDQKIVFVTVTDPVGDGFIKSLAQPGGHVTGFSQYDYRIGEKWIELLLDAAPGTKSFLVIMAADNPSSEVHLATLRDVGSNRGVSITSIKVRSIDDVTNGISGISPLNNIGLILLPGFLPASETNVSALASLVISNKIPSITSAAIWAQKGILLSYSPDQAVEYKQAAVYVDRVLRGEAPGGLPVQFSQSYKLTINTNAARALGIEIPLSLIARADEVIE